MKPTSNRIIISPEKADAKTESGIILPMNANKDTGFGSVVATGRDVKDVSTGDRVFYDLRNTIAISENGIQYHLTEEPFIFAKEPACES